VGRTDDSQGLRAHRVTHFACHGITSYRYPSSSGVVLFDGVLPVTVIAGQRLSAECVYLSACDTHAPGTENVDEVVTLATALNYVGCRHVIAALSPIGDEDAITVAGHVYQRLMRSGRLDLTDAADDEKWDAPILESMDVAYAFGGHKTQTPTIVVRADPPYGFKGPVMAPAPTGPAALRMWDAIQVLAQEPGFFEITRPRVNRPRVTHP